MFYTAFNLGKSIRTYPELVTKESNSTQNVKNFSRKAREERKGNLTSKIDSGLKPINKPLIRIFLASFVYGRAYASAGYELCEKCLKVPAVSDTVVADGADFLDTHSCSVIL